MNYSERNAELSMTNSVSTCKYLHFFKKCTDIQWGCIILTVKDTSDMTLVKTTGNDIVYRNKWVHAFLRVLMRSECRQHYPEFEHGFLNTFSMLIAIRSTLWLQLKEEREKEKKRNIWVGNVLFDKTLLHYHFLFYLKMSN